MGSDTGFVCVCVSSVHCLCRVCVCICVLVCGWCLCVCVFSSEYSSEYTFLFFCFLFFLFSRTIFFRALSSSILQNASVFLYIKFIFFSYRLNGLYGRNF